jgi:hypothetical protein
MNKDEKKKPINMHMQENICSGGINVEKHLHLSYIAYER